MDYTKLYTDFLAKHANMKRPLKIVCDASNGAAGNVLKTLTSKLQPTELILINGEPNGDFPAHGPNPLLAGATDSLSKKVVEERADMGAVFDADGDRAFFCDEKGNILPSHITAALLFRNSTPPFVADELVYQALRALGIFSDNELYPSRVGVFFVKQTMKQVQASTAAEFSGHYYFKDFFGADSGIFAMLTMANILSVQSKALSQLAADLPQHTVKNTDIRIEGKSWPDIEKKIQDTYSAPNISIGHRDGITIVTESSWVNARPSNTEPILRLYAGSPDEAQALRLLEEIKALV